MAADPHNEFVIAYHLIIDNKRITEAQNRIQINDFFVASSPPTSSFFMDMVSSFFVLFINVGRLLSRCPTGKYTQFINTINVNNHD